MISCIVSDDKVARAYVFCGRGGRAEVDVKNYCLPVALVALAM